MAKGKLENLCRELQRHSKAVAVSAGRMAGNDCHSFLLAFGENSYVVEQVW